MCVCIWGTEGQLLPSRSTCVCIWGTEGQVLPLTLSVCVCVCECVCACAGGRACVCVRSFVRVCCLVSLIILSREEFVVFTGLFVLRAVDDGVP